MLSAIWGQVLHFKRKPPTTPSIVISPPTEHPAPFFLYASLMSFDDEEDVNHVPTSNETGREIVFLPLQQTQECLFLTYQE